MALASSRCYWPNDLPVSQFNYQTCYAGSDPNHAACCELSNSVCTEEGYCIGDANLIYRGGCTDKSFASSSCPKQCIFSVNKVTTNGFVNLYDCSNGTYTNNENWCCGRQDSEDCCANTVTVNIGRPYSPSSTSSSASASDTNSGTAVVTTSTPPNPSAASATSSSQSSAPSPATNADGKTLGIGIGVGIGVGALCLIALIYFLFTERKKRNALQRQIEEMKTPLNPRNQNFSPNQYQGHGQPEPTRLEKDGRTTVLCMMGRCITVMR